MSTFKVEAVTIEAIEPHPNADRLELAKIKGWQCVVPKGQYKENDFVLYIPMDAILPESVEAILFGPDAKIKLSKHRVKTIKLRGAISQGIIADFDLFPAIRNIRIKDGDDLAETLGIKKYEPAEEVTTRGGKIRTRKETNPNFFKYTDIENAKNYPNVFVEGEQVVVTEKIHGTSFRAGWVPSVADTWWKKVRQFFGKLPEWDFVYGSRNVQLQNGNPLNGDPAYENIYSKAVKKFDLKNIIPKNRIIYGEIYGEGIQAGYDYGLTRGEFGLVLFDIMLGNTYLNATEFKKTAIEFTKGGLIPNFIIVPELYRGSYSLEKMKELAKGPSILWPQHKIREGCVAKPTKEVTCHMGRKILKFINDDYLLKDQTDFH